MIISYTHSLLNTPLGEILILASTQALIGAWFLDQKNLNTHALQTPRALDHPVHHDAHSWLKSYFSKRCPNPTDLPLQFNDASPLQTDTWQALKEINFGETISYLALAQKIGRPQAARAVASAVAKNPLIIFLPCHRVIGTDGTLKGYSAGLTRKQSLLNLECQD